MTEHEIWDGPVEDEPFQYPVRSSARQFIGSVISVRTDEVDFDGHVVRRDVVEHPGAVGIMALDEQDRVLLIRQYRHPVGMYLFEPPAGLLDVDGEDPLETAKRELLEEGGYVATSWEPLVSFFNSPGGSDEFLAIYLARGLTAADGGRVHTGEAEEKELPQVWVPLDEAVGLIFSGKLRNPTAVVGVLAALKRGASRATTSTPSAP